MSEPSADLLDLMPKVGKAGSALSEAKDFRCDVLADGEVASEAVKEQAAEEGISSATLRRACKALKVTKMKDGQKGGWSLRLPG